MRNDDHRRPTPGPAAILSRPIHPVVQLLMARPAHRHKVTVFLVGAPRAVLVLLHTVIGNVVQIQAPGSLESDLTDLAGRFKALATAVTEPPLAPPPPGLRPQILAVVLVPGAL